jgi:hypothetical protein
MKINMPIALFGKVEQNTTIHNYYGGQNSGTTPSGFSCPEESGKDAVDTRDCPDSGDQESAETHGL